MKMRILFCWLLGAFFCFVMAAVLWFLCYLHFSLFSSVAVFFLLFFCFVFSFLSIAGMSVFGERFREKIRVDESEKTKRLFWCEFIFRVFVTILSVAAYYLIVLRIGEEDRGMFLTAVVLIFAMEHIMSTKRFYVQQFTSGDKEHSPVKDESENLTNHIKSESL